MASLQIVPVQTAAELEMFIRFPWQVYRGSFYDPLWVPPLLQERRSFFRSAPFLEHAQVQLFLALRGTTPVGTISAHLNHAHTARYHDQVGFWGFFEVLDDAVAAQALLHAAATWVAAQGYTHIRGPFNFSVNEECGLLIKGFDTPPVAMMTYNPPRYVEYVEQAGFYPIQDLYAWLWEFDTMPVAAQEHVRKVQRVAAVAQSRYAVTIRPLNLRQFEQEIDLGWHVYNQAWADNWGAVPMTRKEFQHLAYSLKPLLDPQLILIAEIKQQPVGILVALPDLNQPLRAINGRLLPWAWLRFLRARRQIDLVRVLIMGVLPNQRRKGIDAALYQAFWAAALQRGYRRAELSWILETNQVMNQTIAHLGGQLYKTYRLYERALA